MASILCRVSYQIAAASRERSFPDLRINIMTFMNIILLTICLLLIGGIVGFLGGAVLGDNSFNMRRDPEVPIISGRSVFTSPIKFRFNNAHWHYSSHFKKYAIPNSYCAHSPKDWPWWRLVSFSVVRLGIDEPSVGCRLWAYTRWGALYWDLYMDRRIK